MRTEFGKGGARRTRRAGKIPAVIYGHGADPRHVSLPDREFANAIRHGGHNVLITLDIEGDEQLVIPKAIQRHAIKNIYEHVDLVAVRRGEKVTIDVPLSVVGDVIVDGMLAQDRTSVSIEAEATHLPTRSRSASKASRSAPRSPPATSRSRPAPSWPAIPTRRS